MFERVLNFVANSPYNIVGVALLAGYGIHLLVWSVLAYVARKTRTPFDNVIVQLLRAPTRLIFTLVALQFINPRMRDALSKDDFHLWSGILSALTIAAVAWSMIRLSAVLETALLHGQKMNTPDNLAARRIYTQVQILRKVVVFAIILIAVGLIFMSFDQFRRIGTGLLASAGVMGVIVGFAAQRALGNLLAGIQIAMTQPIRHDDVVVVENEWGVIEEITLTYVVVRIWDLRRLIVPISYFLEKPFQNWTRTSSKVLGTVFLWVDYSIPLDRLRAELSRIVQASPHWDKDLQQIVVTNCDQKAMELRVLVSAASGPLSWDLRVEVREKLLTFIQKNFKSSLPVLRAEIKNG